MTTHDPVAVQGAIDHLRRLAGDNGGRVPTDFVRATAQRFGCCERTVWNWLRNGPPSPKSKQELTRKALLAIAEASGNRKHAWAALSTAGDYDRSYRQFMRDFGNLSPIMAEGLTKGIKGALQKGLYLKPPSTARLDRVLFDHTEADIRLQRVHCGKLEMYRPWISPLLDFQHRLAMACVVTEGDGLRGDPNTEVLATLMASAIRGSEAADGTFVGGVPHVVQCDNAKAHLAEAMLNGYLHLGISLHTIKPGSPWEDGRIERFMLTMNTEFLATLPGYTGVLGDRYEHDPWTPEDCLTTEEFVKRLNEWIDAYNYERVHSELGMTPFEAWRADPTPITRVDDDQLRHAFMAVSTGRKVSKNGVRFDGVDYVHRDLKNLVGKKVTVRHLPNDRTFIEVYVDDNYLCTAKPHERLSKDERTRIIRDRNNEVAKVNRIIKRSRKRELERELEGNPLLSPERDPEAPARVIDDGSDEEFLAFAEEAAAADAEADQ